jgi:hypothetical protein
MWIAVSMVSIASQKPYHLQAILPGSFGSVGQLVDAIMQYLAQHNLNPKRYVWRAKGEEILVKIQRAWKAALGENKDVTIISETRD